MHNVIVIQYSIILIAKCGHPNLLQQVNNDSVPIIDAYDSIPFLEGSTIRFSCPSGYELTGPNSANCTGNGEWEPDPSGLMCNVSEGYNYTLHSSVHLPYLQLLCSHV